jgi:hypothetical protein
MTDPTTTRRLCPTPAWLIFGLLIVEGLLWLYTYLPLLCVVRDAGI